MFKKAHPNFGKPKPFLSNQMGPITDYVGIVYLMSRDVLTVPQIVWPSRGPLEQVVDLRFWSKGRS